MKLPQARVVVVVVAALAVILVMLTWPRQKEGMETKKVKAAVEDVKALARAAVNRL
jgi:ABC-type transporter Mla subunit MlaD